MSKIIDFLINFYRETMMYNSSSKMTLKTEFLIINILLMFLLKIYKTLLFSYIKKCEIKNTLKNIIFDYYFIF